MPTYEYGENYEIIEHRKPWYIETAIELAAPILLVGAIFRDYKTLIAMRRALIATLWMAIVAGLVSLAVTLFGPFNVMGGLCLLVFFFVITFLFR